MNDDAGLRCPLCRGASRTWTARPGRELRRCLSCRFAWVPEGVMQTETGQSIYEDASLFDEQADYYRDESTIDAAEDKLAWVVAHARGGGRLLDVGANFGYFTRSAARRFDACGIEPSPVAVRWGREHLQAPIEVGSVDDARPEFHGRFDVITLFDVIEHVPDPRAALSRCQEWLKPGGRLFISTPDAGSAVARLLDRSWWYIDLTQHVSLFTRGNLTQLLEQTGFATLATRTIGRRYKLSYVEQRLGQLAADAPLLRLAHLAAQPLRLAGTLRVPLNFGDVMGIVAERR